MTTELTPVRGETVSGTLATERRAALIDAFLADRRRRPMLPAQGGVDG